MLPDLTVAIITYQGQDWVRLCLHAHLALAAAPERLQFLVVYSGAEDVHEAYLASAQAVSPTLAGRVTPVRIPRAPGTDPPFPDLFKACFAHCKTPLLVLSDQDACPIRYGWDNLVRHHLRPQAAALVGINPRGREFVGHVEWNWCAMRPALFQHCLPRTFERGQHHDWGHMFTAAVRQAQQSQYLWHHTRPWRPNRSPVFCGDPLGDLIFHAFYATRQQHEKLAPSEFAYCCSPQETQELQAELYLRIGHQITERLSLSQRCLAARV